MAPLKIDQFGGMLPAWDEKLLPAGQSAAANNAYLFSGALAGWRRPKLLRQLNSSTASFVFRVPVITLAFAHAEFIFQANPDPAETVTLGEETYTFVTATVTNSYDVLIGATADETANNLLSAFTIDNNTGLGAGVKYGIGTCFNPAITQNVGVNVVDHTDLLGPMLPIIKVRAVDAGAAFNTETVSAVGIHSNVWFNFDRLVTGDGLIGVATFYGGANSTFDNTITSAAAKWLEFEDPLTSVMRSQVVDDKFQRLYFSDPTHPPTYNTYDRVQADQPAWRLGITPPGCAPIVAIAGGGSAIQTGHPEDLPGLSALGANTIVLQRIFPTSAQELEDISFMPAETLAAARYAGVLYDDQGGAPFELLNFTNVIVGVVSGTQETLQFVNPTGLLANVPYWIGIMSDTITSVKSDVAHADYVQFSNPFVNGPPTFAGTTSSAARLQMWADLQSGAVISARSYVYTYVTEYGEESAPSPPTLVNGWDNGVWTIALWQPPPDDMGVLRNIKKIRLYRTITSAGGTAVFFFVKELDIGTATYVDTTLDNIIAGNNILQSTTWFPPPEDLYGIQALPNGMAVGFRGNEVWFCEPYQLHAWPPGYVLTTEFPIIGLGVTGNAVVACTSGTPYVIQGVNPASMGVTKTSKAEPCISFRSIVGTDAGVYYASPNGLILVTQYAVVTNTTETWVTSVRWKALTPQKNLHAVLLASGYFSFGVKNGTDVDVAKQGYYVELGTSDADSFTIWPQPGHHRIGFEQLSSMVLAEDGTPLNIRNIQVDPWTGTGIVIADDGNVYYYDFRDATPVIAPYKWRSKKYQANTKRNMAVMRVFWKIPDGGGGITLAPVRLTATTTDAAWNSYDDTRYGFVRVFASDENGVMQLVTVRELRRPGEVLRILGGFKSDVWQFEFEGVAEISNLQAAGTVKELAEI